MAAGVAQLSDEQGSVISVVERVTSVFSLLGLTFIFVTFSFGEGFRKPINRLMFFAAFGDAIYNIATLVARSGIEAGEHSALCQFQGFVIEMFLLSDTLWNLSMAINVWLTVFKKYDSSQLRSLEWKYGLVNYGGPFILALILTFVQTEERGQIYGDALLWCWIDIKWDFLRMVCLYGPAWVLLVTIFALYLFSGLEIYKKHRALKDFNSSTNNSQRRSQAPNFSTKTTEVHVTTELADLSSPVPREILESRQNLDKAESTYNVTIGRGDVEHQATPREMREEKKTAVKVNNAAWAYTRCAIMFFIALLITWLPSTINRVYSLVNPTSTNWPLNLAAAIVLPLMGFWNTIIYIVTSWTACRRLFSHILASARRMPKPQTKSSLANRPPSPSLASPRGPWHMMGKGRNKSGSESSEENLTLGNAKRSPPDSLFEIRR